MIISRLGHLHLFTKNFTVDDPMAKPIGGNWKVKSNIITSGDKMEE
jgi:hypothetical protein